MLNKIAHWLQNPERSFEDGLKIYHDYKVDTKLDKLFAAENPEPKSLPFTILHQKVETIYRKLVANPSLIKHGPIAVSQIDTEQLKKKFAEHNAKLESKRPTIVENPLVDVKELPDDLKKLYFENKEKAKLRAGMHTQMAKLSEDESANEDRKKLAEDICQLDDEIADNWKIIDTWWTDRKNNKVTTAEAKSLMDKVKRINNLNNYINRANAEIAKNPKLKEDREAKINKWQEELDSLQTTNE